MVSDLINEFEAEANKKELITIKLIQSIAERKSHEEKASTAFHRHIIKEIKKVLNQQMKRLGTMKQVELTTVFGKSFKKLLKTQTSLIGMIL